jgi:arginine N-succinyltransferase
MVIVRPAKESDLDGLLELAGMSKFGLTSLPGDRDVLKQRIQDSCRSFQLKVSKPGGELYIFVLEDLDSSLVVGTALINSKVGGFEPFYAFRIKSCTHKSEHLKICNKLSLLLLIRQHSGPSEIGGLFIAPSHRKHGQGRLLSLFRFLYMTEHSHQFEPLVLAEMRGVVDENGRSPFWEAIGRHFFDMNYPRADYMSLSDKRFISELMPRSPIYICMLPKEAQDVIGKVHENTRPALKMLKDEGFSPNGMVDIFDAGPVVVCRLDDVRIVRESNTVTIEEITLQSVESPDCIIAGLEPEFRACVGKVRTTPNGGALLEALTAAALNLDVGDKVIFSPLRPSSPAQLDTDHKRPVDRVSCANQLEIPKSEKTDGA